MPVKDNYRTVYETLYAILKPYEPYMVVGADGEQGYSLNTTKTSANRKPVFFGAAQIRKNYVSFYLMPVYACPELLEGISPELKRRMQGKSCFNFTHIDPALVQELAQLTQRSFEHYQKAGMV